MDLLITKHKPILYFHPNESFFPSSPDYYLQHCSIVDSDNTVLISKPSQTELYDLFRKNRDARMVLNSDSDERVKLGDSTMQSSIYAYVQNFESDKIHITYVFFYPYNGWYDVLGLAKVGYHNADIEQFTVELDRETESPLRYFYASHGHGSWHDADTVSFEGSHPVAYAAIHGHGLYSKPGVYFRIYGLASDKTSKSDFRWDSDIIRIYPEDHPKFDKETQGWFYYEGNWADNGISGIPLKGWFNKLPPTSATKYMFQTRTWNTLALLAKLLSSLLLLFLSNKIVTYFDDTPLSMNYKKIFAICLISVIVIMIYVFFGRKAVIKYGSK
jgi:hypothetical protein